MKAYERRAAKRERPLLRDPRKDSPDCDTMVLVLVEQDEDEPVVTAAYDAGSCWRCAISARPISGLVRGWCHMHEAVKLLTAAKAGGGK